MKPVRSRSLISQIKKLGRPVFSTFELTALSGKSASTVTQSLNYLRREGAVIKISRGLWAETGAAVSAYTVVPYLFPRGRAYVSFVSALHLHGIIEQIPRVITLASTAHTRTVRTSIAVYSVHRIDPAFFSGFAWYKGNGSFLIAEAEKALVDSLYLSARRKKQFGHFPELRFPGSFSFPRAFGWSRRIPDIRIRSHVRERLQEIKKSARKVS